MLYLFIFALVLLVCTAIIVVMLYRDHTRLLAALTAQVSTPLCPPAALASSQCACPQASGESIVTELASAIRTEEDQLVKC